jgi:lipid II:glycine glycyltransferase (peptidoglycan interpeptide bridge formation enzyme)
MNLQAINPLQFPHWDDMIQAHPEASFFHSSTWAHVLSESYHYTPVYFSAINTTIDALVPLMDIKSVLTGHRGVSLPFTDYCEPIMSNPDSFHEIMDYIIEKGRQQGWEYMELRGGESFLKETPPCASYYGHTLQLTRNHDDLLSSFRESTRRNIHKAEKQGVKVTLCTDEEAVKAFYKLNCLTRRHHGLPPQPFYFFKKVHEHILSKNHGFIALALHEGSPIAGDVFFHFGRKAMYKYGASDRNYQHLRANNLVMWDAIKWFCQNGYENLCFGRTETDNDGLRQFKSGWGTKEHIIKYYRYDLRKSFFVKESSKISAFQHKIFNKLPIPILIALGALLYRHMG